MKETDKMKESDTLPRYSSFHSVQSVTVPNPLRLLANGLVGLCVMLALFLTFTPWVQTAAGYGVVTTFHPSDKPQHITAPVKGRIGTWHVHEGTRVKKGDLLLEIVDNDPHYIERLELELAAAKKKAEVAHAAAETSKIDYIRKQELFSQGLSSRHDFEKAKINYNEYLAKQAEALATLAKAQTNRTRQDTQIVRAPSDGTIVQMRSGDAATFLKEGDVVANFIPSETIPAVELYVDGLDVPLINSGSKVRLQFEGWPAIQFSGWPSISVGSFVGVVRTVDPTVSANGKFRVLIVQAPSEKWPNQNFLRFGARVKGWVLLNTVSLGYEWWRQMNNFPPLPSSEKKNEYMTLRTYETDVEKSDDK
jgi:multidrug efflux pump subunit AcrA (membrane-fusion protein)